MMHSDTCQWIGTELGYVRLQPTCCNPTVAGKSYCVEHVDLVYKKGTAVHRKKDIRTSNNVRLIEQLMNEAIEELIEEGEI